MAKDLLAGEEVSLVDFNSDDVVKAKTHVLEMRKRKEAVATAAKEAAEPLKAIFKGFNVCELDEALERVGRLLKDDMRI